jgi:excisionase family DNA binding protein
VAGREINTTSLSHRLSNDNLWDMRALDNKLDKPFFSLAEVARVLGVSRVAVLKRINNGKLKAQKVGKAYIVSKADLQLALGVIISDEQQEEIGKVVKRAVKEYGTTFRRLGKEE